MNKVFNVNIGGLIFSVDELAFDKLNSYISSIKSHFTNTDGKDEIIADIEARIAEMLREKIRPGKEVITMDDLDSIIAVMGKPEDFGDGETEENTAGQSSEKTEYSSAQGQQTHRRLYRDIDNKIIGGVCSGMSAYFGINDPIWLRIAFLVLFFTGPVFCIVYIILMLIMPKARTITEKMETRGENININNIKKTFDEEIDDLKKNFNDMKNPAARQRVHNGMESFFDFLGEILHFTGRLLVKIIAWAFAVVGIFMLVALSLFFRIISMDDLGLLGDLPHHNIFMITGLSLFIGIPILAIIAKSLKYLFHIKINTRVPGVIMGVLWVVGLVLLIFTGGAFCAYFQC